MVDQVNLKSILSIGDDFIERNFFFIPWAPLSPGKGRFISETFRYPSQPTDTPRTPEMTVTLAGPSDLSRFSFDSPRLSPRELLGETCCDLLM